MQERTIARPSIVIEVIIEGKSPERLEEFLTEHGADVQTKVENNLTGLGLTIYRGVKNTPTLGG